MLVDAVEGSGVGYSSLIGISIFYSILSHERFFLLVGLFESCEDGDPCTISRCSGYFKNEGSMVMCTEIEF